MEQHTLRVSLPVKNLVFNMRTVQKPSIWTVHRKCKNTARQKSAKKQKILGVLLKTQYQKADHILSRIVKNKKAGAVAQRVEKDLAMQSSINTTTNVWESSSCNLLPSSVIDIRMRLSNKTRAADYAWTEASSNLCK